MWPDLAMCCWWLDAGHEIRYFAAGADHPAYLGDYMPAEFLLAVVGWVAWADYIPPCKYSTFGIFGSRCEQPLTMYARENLLVKTRGADGAHRTSQMLRTIGLLPWTGLRGSSSRDFCGVHCRFSVHSLRFWPSLTVSRDEAELVSLTEPGKVT